MECDYCKNEIDPVKVRKPTGGNFEVVSDTKIKMPFNCRRCGGSFCTKHRLPENHNCVGLKPPIIIDLKNIDIEAKTPIDKLNDLEKIKRIKTETLNDTQGKNERTRLLNELYELDEEIDRIKKSLDIKIESTPVSENKKNYICQFCFKSFEHTQKCQKCGLDLCQDHIFNHSCIKAWDVDEPHKKEYVGPSRQKPKTIEKIKSFLKRRYYRAKSWLNSKHHRSYRNWNAFFMNILWVVILSISFMIIYSNLSKLNEIYLWFLPLGGTLLLVNTFLWLKYFWKLLKKIYYRYNGERNWIKYLILIILILSLWQGYQNRDTLFDSQIEKYNQLDFENILPLRLNFSWSHFNYDSIKDSPERKEECKKAFDYVNEVRKENNRKPMLWDDNLYELAVERSKDMVERNYFDHVTPEGKCVKDFKAEYGFSNYNVAENCGGMTYYYDGNPIPGTSVNEVVDGWLNSRGHRYNLLYSSHTKGAIGCIKQYAYFLEQIRGVVVLGMDRVQQEMKD